MNNEQIFIINYLRLLWGWEVKIFKIQEIGRSQLREVKQYNTPGVN